MAQHTRRDQALKRAEQDLSGHIIRDGLVRSFRFNGLYTDKNSKLERKGDYPFASHIRKDIGKFAYQSAYAFTLTWTPGQIVITGDCGDLTLTHYHAMADFEEAISWALHSDFDYLLGKSNHGTEYIQEETWKQFKNYLNEPVFDALLGSVDWRTRKRDPKYSQRAEFRRWRKEKPNPADFTHKVDYDVDLLSWKEDRPEDIFRMPTCEAWERWNQLNNACAYFMGGLEVTKAADRYRLLCEAEQEFHSEESALNFLYGKMNFDDPYICHDYPRHSYYLIACIQHGCRMIQQHLGISNDNN